MKTLSVAHVLPGSSVQMAEEHEPIRMRDLHKNVHHDARLF